MSTPIGEILNRKGTHVVTIDPQRTLADVVAVLEENSIGALVVSRDRRAVDGIVSERDVIRSLARSGTAALGQPVTSAMTHSVVTCNRDATADELMAMMTNSRCRHVPVVEDGVLSGIISIGDVVKSRIDELEVQTETLEKYVTGTSY